MLSNCLLTSGRSHYSAGLKVSPCALLSVMITVVIFGSLPIEAATWRNHTNVNGAFDLLPVGDTVWAATSGGLVMFSGADVRTFTNADGLGDNHLLFVTMDGAGLIWTGGQGGRLSVLDRATGEWKAFEFRDRDGQPLRLTAAAADGDFLWVGSNVGVHKFDTRHYGGEIKETYRRFGNLPADEPVNDVRIVGDFVWVATGAGCAQASREDINLQDFSHWRSYTRLNSGLQDDDVRALAGGSPVLYAATSTGVYAFQDQGFAGVWSAVPGPQVECYGLFDSSGEILVATASGIQQCTDDGCALLTTAGMAELRTRAVCKTAEGKVWAASYSGVGYSLFDGAAWVDSVVSGLASNTVHDVAATPDGSVWVVHPEGKPLSTWNGTQWRWVDAYLGAPENVLAVDSEGWLWVGGHGSGVTRLNPADPQNGVQHFDETNSPLRGTKPPPDDWYIVVLDIVVDDVGRLWFANTFDYDDRVLVFYDHGCWGYFGTRDGFGAVEPMSLFPLRDEVLVGFLGNGLADVDLDTTTSLCVNGSPVPQQLKMAFFDDGDGLPTNQVRCFWVDAARKVWVGTSGGLAYFDGVLRRFRTFPLGETPAPTINALLGDGGNNLWVGADEGLFVISPDGQVTQYSPDNSGLVDRKVAALAIDAGTSTVWIGTAGGVSEFIGAAERATPVNVIIAYPNPFIISRGDELLKFDAAYGTTIRIFTAAGDLVADLGTAGEWNGRNQAGKLVAGGVYLFVASDPQGNFGRGKFAVIRK